jgi:hypothetical protein
MGKIPTATNCKGTKEKCPEINGNLAKKCHSGRLISDYAPANT